MLDPQARALLDKIAELGVPPTHELPVETAREFYRDRRGATQPDPVAVADTSDVDIGPCQVRTYRPAGYEGDGPLGALLYLHGGGWTIGDLDTHDTLCRSLCNEAQVVVCSVDYRMGPEHKFPVAVDDTMAALDWLVANAQTLGVDPTRIAVGGDSAGGNLAAVAALTCRDNNGPALAMQLLIYPATDQRAGHDSHHRNGEGYLLTRATMDWFRDQYHASASEYLDWRASPLLAERHDNLPPPFVLTAGFDPLVDEGKAYAEALSQAGVAVDAVCYERQIHGFITMGRVIEEANQAVTECSQALRQSIGPETPV
jgi:acetyl esterase